MTNNDHVDFERETEETLEQFKQLALNIQKLKIQVDAICEKLLESNERLGMGRDVISSETG